MARRTAETMKTQPGHKPVTTRHPDDEALAGDPEARLEEARYRQSTAAEQQLATSLAAFLEAHGTDDALLRWLATLIVSRIGDALMGRLPDLTTAQRVARHFDYDYSGVHIVPHRDHFRLFACGFKGVVGAGADAVSYDGARAWPRPRIYLAPRGPCLSDRGSRPGA